MVAKNPDYTESAVNLCNPDEVREALVKLAELKSQLDNAEMALAASPEYKHASDCAVRVEEVEANIKGLVEKHGSYQQPVCGAYAVKQRKVTMVYSVSLVKAKLPDLAGDIIVTEETVDKKAIERLIKDGFTTEEAVAQCGRPRESFVYIIEVGEGVPDAD